jgi:hypothetical protein
LRLWLIIIFRSIIGWHRLIIRPVLEVNAREEEMTVVTTLADEDLEPEITFEKIYLEPEITYEINEH